MICKESSKYVEIEWPSLTASKATKMVLRGA